MGASFSTTTLSAGSAGIDVPELADLSYEKPLGNARFMKSIRARHKNGLVVAKVVMKPYPSLKLNKYIRALQEERRTLAEIPNALAYHRLIETSTNGYLVRQFIHSSVYDRISTRPFLEHIEKRWLSFQLLCAVRDCHARNVYHGDIKTENTLVTSWNWLYLSDFSSSFKPTYLPLDNPADFSFYFDTSGRRTCYLAPERFLEAGETNDGGVTWAMDIFSVGCVIAELFLESPIFSLSQLFRYKNDDYDPLHATLSRIEDHDVREMVTHMISRDPEQRYSAEEYLNFWRQKTFPEYFYSFLHQYMHLITDSSSGRAQLTAGKDNLGESDERIDRVYYDFDKISFFLGYEDSHADPAGRQSRKPRQDLFPLQVDIPNNSHEATAALSHTVDDGTLIFLQLVVSSLRSTARSTARAHACELLLAFAERLTDEAKLDRVVPYLMSLLQDPSEVVKVAALRTLTQVVSTRVAPDGDSQFADISRQLALVTVVSPINANIFSEYILPRLLPFSPGHSSKPSSLIRATYASCIASLATTASRYLDLVQGLQADGYPPTTDPETEDGPMSHSVHQNLYDAARMDLIKQFEDQTKRLLQDSDAVVRRAFLGSVATLCVFFGSTKSSDVILSHLNTYLNDKDWQLKCAFFETIVGVATYVGDPAFEEFILPLMVQALIDPEEFVVERAIRSFSAIADLGLLQRARTWELLDVVARFTMHPNIWIREAAAQFISASTKYLSTADKHSIISPLIKVYLRAQLSDFSELRILDALKKPLPRLILETACLWALRAEQGLFWKQARQQRWLSLGSEDAIPVLSGRDVGPRALSKVPKNDEDENWLKKLQGLGMAVEDEFKLLALREYIWRVAQRRSQEAHDKAELALPHLDRVVELREIHITPQTVLFDDDPQTFVDNEAAIKQRLDHPRTIAEAMLDASMTVNEGVAKRKRSNLDRILQREGLAPRSTPVAILSPASPSSPMIQMSPAQSNSPKGSCLDDDETSSRGAGSLRHVRTSSLGEQSHTLRHQNSAMSLLGRGEGRNKALPEIGTSSANAVGSVEGTFNRERSPGRPSDSQATITPRDGLLRPPAPDYQLPHSYDGNDPTILRLLGNLYLEHYPSENLDFGPQVLPIRGREPIKRNGGGTGPWQPQGVLVAMLSEHTASVNRVAVSPNHAFFITGSDDGTVRVWDTRRLERNITHRSRQVHKHSADAKVTGLCFVENTCCFVSSATDGSVHVVRVQYDVVDGERGMLHYSRLRVVREFQLERGQYAVWIEHYRSKDLKSIVVLATNDSHIIAIDLRNMSVLFDLSNPLKHGTPSTFCLDRKHQWLLLGTTHGVLDLWDLRFLLRLKSWIFPGGAPVHRLTFSPIKHGTQKDKIVVAGGTGQGEITVWDLQKGVCKEVYRTGVAPSQENLKSYRLLDVDEEKADSMLERFGPSMDSPSSGSGGAADKGIRALVTGLVVLEKDVEARNWFMISAGPDWKVRYWNVKRSDTSCVVSGLQVDEGPSYSETVHRMPDMTIVQEHLHQAVDSAKASTGSRSADSTPRKTDRGRQQGKATASIVSAQTQNLLKSNLDTIMDVALLELPYGMVVSVDRAGVIYVFS